MFDLHDKVEIKINGRWIEGTVVHLTQKSVIVAYFPDVERSKNTGIYVQSEKRMLRSSPSLRKMEIL